MKRILTAGVLAPLAWWMVKGGPPTLFLAFGLVISGIATWECCRLFESRGRRPFTALSIAGSASLGVTFFGLGAGHDVHVPILVVLVLALVAVMWARPDPGAMTETVVATVFPVLFVGLLLGFPVAIRVLPGEDGPDLVLLLFVCVFSADGAAFYAGRAFGRTRLAPRLSPKKSWEGAVAGVMASVLGAALAHLWFYQRIPWRHALVIGLVLGVAGVLGDLAESMVKRAAGVKDASGLLPGHGGLLDRVDGLLFAGPILYYYYLAFLRGSA